jgi:hypothetical protein
MKRAFVVPIIAVLTLAGSAVAFSPYAEAGLKYDEQFTTVPPNDYAFVWAYCPKRTHVVNGGVFSSGGNVGVEASMPVDSSQDSNSTPDDEWFVRVRNFSGINNPIYAYAVCARATPSYLNASDHPLDGNDQTTSYCLGGLKATAAGGFIYGGYFRTWMSYRDESTTVAYGGGGATLAPSVICVGDDLKVSYVSRFNDFDLGAGTEKSLRCPKHKGDVLGGGVRQESIDTYDLRTSVSAPSDTNGDGRPDRWRLSITPGGDTETLDTVVACAK